MAGRRSLLIGAAAFALGKWRAARAQTIRRVASLSVGTTRTPQFGALRRRFAELGYVEGRNFLLDAHEAGGQWTRLPDSAAKLARGAPEVVIAIGSEPVLKAVRQAVGATPIVMVAVDFDPVEKNYVATLARPGGNITGVYFRQIESAAKRLELLKQALPGVTRVGVFFDASTRDQLQAAQHTAARLGLTLVPHELRGAPYDFDAASKVVGAANAQAVLSLSSGAFFPLRNKLIAAAHEQRLPVIANPNYAEAGALVAFGASYPHMYVRAAEYADRILRGARAAELPVEQPSSYELVVNLKTAKALGVAVPPAVLVRATRVVE
jgi:putative ABC transport system substrate-binding protein